MTQQFSTKRADTANWLLLVATAFILFSSCKQIREEIPEPDYNPHVLSEGIYIEAAGITVDMDSTAPPDTIIVEPQWVTAKNLGSEPFVNNFTNGSKPRFQIAEPQILDMSKFTQPIYVQGEGLKLNLKMPPANPTKATIESYQDNHLGQLNHEHGLQSDWIECLLEDRFGRIWMGTNVGLSIWDGASLINLNKQHGLPGSYVQDIFEDSKGNFWIAFETGLAKWNGEYFAFFDKTRGLSDSHVSTIGEDNSGNIWVGTQNGLNMWDGKRFHQYYTEQGLSNNLITSLTIDKEGRVWIGTWGGGIVIKDGKDWQKLSTEQGLSVDDIEKLFTDSQGRIWIGTGKAGLNMWNGRGINYFNQQEGLNDFQLPAILESSSGQMWVGGNFGAHNYTGIGFRTVSSDNGLKFNAVRCLMEDSGGRIWIGTAGGGVHFLTNMESNHLISDEPPWFWSGFHTLIANVSGNMVLGAKLGLITGDNTMRIRNYDLQIDGYAFDACAIQGTNGNIVIGSGGGIKVIKPESLNRPTQKYRYFQLGDKAGNDHLQILSLLSESNKSILMGCRADQGVYKWMNPDTNGNATFLHYGSDQGIVTTWIYDLLEDKDGKIWIASSEEGISVWSGNTVTRYTTKNGLTDNGIIAMAMDVEGKIWIGSRSGGLAIWDGKGFTHYSEQHGFPSNRIDKLHIDSEGNVWAGTLNGLVKLWQGPDGKIYYKKYNEYQGVTNSRVLDIMIDDSKKLLVASGQNLDIVDLNQQAKEKPNPKLTIRSVQPFFDNFDWRKVNSDITAGLEFRTGDQQIPLSTISYDSVESFNNLPVNPEFPHNINNLTFRWSATYWADPTSVLYSYILEGQEHSWSPLTNKTNITYNNLSPGDYTLKVRAVAGSAQWSNTANYSFTITPPLWATWWAYIFYGLCAVSLVLGIRHYERKRFMLKQQTRSLKALDQAKSKFFTNISHELRTPITLILGPLKALQQGTYQGDKESLYHMMSQNGRRLLQLVNQLLDLSKLDQDKLKLQLEDCHLNELIRQVIANFESTCSLKGIKLVFHNNNDSIYCRLDIQRIRQVLYNLISNAVKFTREDGRISVSITRLSHVQAVPGDQVISIKIKDTGIGIPREELQQIFNRFYQVKNISHDESAGTGVGLALAQKLVHLHLGTIEAESEPGWGATFTVTLPLIAAESKNTPALDAESHSDLNSEPNTSEVTHISTPFVAQASQNRDTPAQTQTQFTILVVEDNSQMRDFIKSCLGVKYMYLESSNGLDGLKLTEDAIPDLIISDIMMPQMDGYELCRRVQLNSATAHIPFIFLTAKVDEKSQLKGLETGSMDYLTKPFDPKVLQLKVDNLLNRINKLQNYFQKQLSYKEDIEVIESLDQKFLEHAISVVEGQINNHEFSVAEFAQEVGMSQTQLYRKLMALTGQSASAFIRGIRLKKAARLIIQNYGNTSDVAYAVGFSNLSYFAKCFKEQFDIPPSAYAKKVSS